MSVAIDIQTVAKQKKVKLQQMTANHQEINIDDKHLVFSKWLLTLDGTEQWGWCLEYCFEKLEFPALWSRLGTLIDAAETSTQLAWAKLKPPKGGGLSGKQKKRHQRFNE